LWDGHALIDITFMIVLNRCQCDHCYKDTLFMGKRILHYNVYIIMINNIKIIDLSCSSVIIRRYLCVGVNMWGAFYEAISFQLGIHQEES
jgi:hypothetical protein